MARAVPDGASAKEIGQRLALTRSALEVRQNAFAARAGIAANTYNQYEAGVNRINIDSAIALCEAYGLTLDWIYRGDPSGLPYKTFDLIKIQLDT